MTDPDVDVSYYPPKGPRMNLTLADVCLIIIIAVCAVIIVVAGTNVI